MKKVLSAITDRVATKKGTAVTLSIWILAVVLLSIFAPSVRDYQMSSIETLPEDAQSLLAREKIETYFGNSDLIPAILVFQHNEGDEVDPAQLGEITAQMEENDIHGVEEVIPFEKLPPQAAESFLSEDGSTAFIPLNFSNLLDTPDIKESLHEIHALVEENSDLTLHVTGPAGIATDTSELFSRADLVLIMATVGIILVLLVVIYRSPLLAFIPLLAAGIVLQAVMQILGILGDSGLVMSTQSVSIMTILLFAAVIDYSLFIFSRFREELKSHDDKYAAMKAAMRGMGLPVFYSGATIFAAMIILIFASLEDYRNFAPIFGTTFIVIMLASVTLVPALFTLFGRKSFWPVIPRVGDKHIKNNSAWSKIGRAVTKRPAAAVTIIILFIFITASNIFNMEYEFDMLKSFPDDMQSRVGYEILEENFAAGDLAPTTVLFEASDAVGEAEQSELLNTLLDQPLVNQVRVDGVTDDNKVISYSMTFDENPNAQETMDALETIRDDSDEILSSSKLEGELYFAGDTASSVDDRSLNNRDLILIVSLETILIFVMLIFLTKSIRMPVYMMGTILLSFFAALGLGTFLIDLFFAIDTMSNRVPVYAFIFLVALGIDYNIMLVSRFLEERKQHPVKEAVEIAVANTGGVISSAGLILAATFAVLMTQPIQLLFVFGFIVAVGILIDTFLVRGVLLPGLIMLFEKDKKGEKQSDRFSS
ncbi:MMPL family transporter [Oceanobacillus sp. FSL H7-0719]|uniref:MMPL family transporter n=1 Tax=Oceanobacillus sp. FSL H7-0719 TaxID=2954507 RepID=UPI003246DEE2